MTESLYESQIQYQESNEWVTPSKFPWSPNEISQNKKHWGAHMIAIHAEELKHDMLLNTNFTSLSTELRDAILAFAKERDISPEKSSIVREHFRDQPTSLERLLIIRGFLAHGILYFLLESKRWSVDYGLYPKRCLMAVPYLAKDVPSPRAEFGHPDIALGLTCLSYYYDGLTSEQLMTCFHKFRLTGDPSIIYQGWVTDSALPVLLHDERNVFSYKWRYLYL